MAMRESPACPDPEVLAAFIDGRLSADERRRVVVHLDACADCYEVFGETVRFQGEEEPRGRVVGAGRFQRRRWVWAAVAAAAAVILAILVAVPILRMEPERPVVATLPPGGAAGVSAEALVAAIDVEDGEALAVALRPRGGLGFGNTRMDAESASFRVGIWVVGLRAAVRAGDEAAALDAALELAAALEASGTADDLERPLSRVTEAAREGRLGEVDEAAGAFEARAGEELARSPFALGKWTEAGRLAAAVGARGYFGSAAFAAAREEIAEGEPPESVLQAVAQTRVLTRSGEVGPEELEELKALFKDLGATY